MAVDTLRCRVCEAEYPALASGSCLRCFGPLEPVYDWDEVARTMTRQRIEAGPRSLWRYEGLLPTRAPVDAAGAPGWTPLVSAPRLASAVGVGEVFLKLDHTNPTHSFKDRVVGVAAAKAAELGADTLACASTGNLGNAVAARAAASGMRSVVLYPRTVEPEKLLATAVYGGEMYAVRGSYDDCSRLVVELAAELDWAFVNVNLRAYYAEGSKTLAFEIVEQLGWELPDAVIAPVASGSLFTKIWQGFEQFRRIGLVDGVPPRIYGGQAQGCAPVAHAFAADRPVSPVRPATVAQSLAIGAPADGDLAIATARASRGAIYAVPEEDVGPNMSLLAGTSGVFGETAAGVTVGALRAAAAAGDIGEHDRVVVLVTGTGLKTPQLIDARGGTEIEADVDELLAGLGVV
ncbi:MAG: threonine synthase [Gaiellaceae bacterium]|jgi:threonine synthase|nr:threonine synthase [Gaiellaceae bacterium]